MLQAFSLYTAVQEFGFLPTILNYQPYYSNGGINLKRKLIKLATNFLFCKEYFSRKAKFNKIFSREEMTKKVKRYKNLTNYAQGYDIYLIGSDQVWNPRYLCGKDKAYYYDFISNGKKMSYAASLGTEDLSKEELMLIAESICDFQKVSLRERESVLQLQAVGYNGAEYVLDPVFLHEKDFYSNLQIATKEKNYILAYIIQKDPFVYEVVNRLAKLMKKRVVQIGGFASKCKSEKFFRDAGPMEFLGLIDGADFIITSSFHGTAFAHIYHKQFAVVMPKDNTLRIKNILETAGTGNRVITNLDCIENVLNPIDYHSVDQKINAMRAISRKFLADSLRSEEGNK